MSTLAYSSSDADVWQAYDDNASFEEDASPAKAAAFVTACRVLLRRRPNSISVDGQSATFDPAVIRAEMERAIAWNASRVAGNAVRHLSFRGLRD